MNPSHKTLKQAQRVTDTSRLELLDVSHFGLRPVLARQSLPCAGKKQLSQIQLHHDTRLNVALSALDMT